MSPELLVIDRHDLFQHESFKVFLVIKLLQIDSVLHGCLVVLIQADKAFRHVVRLQGVRLLEVVR